MIQLILGPAYSGKSHFAMQRAAAGGPVNDLQNLIISTHPADSKFFEKDKERIVAQSSELLKSKPIFDVDLLSSLQSLFSPKKANEFDCLVVDSINQWVGWLIHEAGGKYDWEQMDAHLEHSASLLCTILSSKAVADIRLILVSCEVGAGPPPKTAGERLFRKHLGILNCKLASQANEVFGMQSGIGQQLKP